MTIKQCDRCKCIQDNTDKFITIKSHGSITFTDYTNCIKNYVFDLCPSCAIYLEKLEECLITSFISYPNQPISIHIGEKKEE